MQSLFFVDNRWKEPGLLKSGAGFFIVAIYKNRHRKSPVDIPPSSPV